MSVKIAGSLADNLHMEAMIRVRVGYGNVVTQLPEIAESYQEARMALEVGRVFMQSMTQFLTESLASGV